MTGHVSAEYPDGMGLEHPSDETLGGVNIAGISQTQSSRPVFPVIPVGCVMVSVSGFPPSKFEVPPGGFKLHNPDHPDPNSNGPMIPMIVPVSQVARLHRLPHAVSVDEAQRGVGIDELFDRGRPRA